jgi:hypothetical protein
MSFTEAKKQVYISQILCSQSFQVFHKMILQNNYICIHIFKSREQKCLQYLLLFHIQKRTFYFKNHQDTSPQTYAVKECASGVDELK